MVSRFTFTLGHDPEWDAPCVNKVPHASGGFVRHSDYEALRDELEQVKRERDDYRAAYKRELDGRIAAERLAGARVKALEESLHLTEYEIQVLLGTSISGCNMRPDRVFSLDMAWHRLRALELIDRADGLAIITEKGQDVVARILAALAEPAGKEKALRELIASYRARFTDEKVDYQRGILDTLDNIEMVMNGTHDEGPPLAEPAGEVEPRQFLATEDGEFNGNTIETPIAAEDGREVDWVDVTGWGVFKGHAIPVDVARYIATKINLYAEQRTTPPDASATREALEKVDAELAAHGYAEIGTLRATIRTVAVLAGAKP